MLPRVNFGKLDSRKRHILHSLDRTQLIYTCILLSFSLSLIIHDSRAEVQRFMIPKQETGFDIRQTLKIKAKVLQVMFEVGSIKSLVFVIIIIL